MCYKYTTKWIKNGNDAKNRPQYAPCPMGFQSHFNICNSTIAPRVNPKRNVTMYLIFQACLQDLQRMQSINRHYKAVNTTQINFTIDITSKINMVISSSRLKMIIIIQKGILHHITSDEGILFVLRPTPFMNILHTCTIYLISRYVVHLSYVWKYVVDVCERSFVYLKS